MHANRYDTLSAAMTALRERGYTDDLDVEGTLIKATQAAHTFDPKEFRIVEFHRFEGDSSADDSAVVYAIESPAHHIKGMLVDAYGSSAEKAEVIRSLQMASS